MQIRTSIESTIKMTIEMSSAHARSLTNLIQRAKLSGGLRSFDLETADKMLASLGHIGLLNEQSEKEQCLKEG